MPEAINQLQQVPFEEYSFKWKGSMPVIKGTFKKQPVILGIDTGAGINLVHDRSYQKWEDKEKKTQSKMVGGFKSARKVPVCSLPELKIGHSVFTEMRAVVYSLTSINKAVAGPNLDGILGYDYLSRFRVGFNFKKKKMYLWDNNQVEEPLLVMKGAR
jgi:hypothetical protein